jgi:ABC-2 type transport system permease protein
MGSVLTDVRHGITIANVEVRRTLRAILSNRRQLIAFGVMLVAFLPAGFVFLTGSYSAGVRFSDGTDLPVVTLARAQVVAWLGTATVLFGLRMIERAGDIDHADLLLTTVSPRAVVTGLAMAEYLRILAVFGTPVALLLSAFALGAGTPLLVPVGVLGFLPLLAVGLLSGFLVGYAGRLVVRRFGGLTISMTAVNIGIVAAVIVGLNVVVPRTMELSELVRTMQPLGALPVGPYADLLLVASPVAVTPGAEAVLAVGIVLTSIPLLLVGTWQLAPRVWYGDPRGSEQTADEETEPRLDGSTVPSLFARGRTTRLVWWLWLRGARAPAQFIHLTYFLFMALPLVQTALVNPRGPLLPIFVGIVGAFLAGGTFGLNPLGVEGSMLPTIMTTPTPGRLLVRARMLAGILVWGPLTGLLVVALGVYGTLSPRDLLLLLAFTGVLMAFSSVLALALGAFSPRFETVRAFGGVEAPTPTTISLLGHSFLTGIVAVLGLAFVFGPDLYDRPPLVGRTELLAQVAGLLFWAISLLFIGGICYRYAIRRMNEFTYV